MKQLAGKVASLERRVTLLEKHAQKKGSQPAKRNSKGQSVKEFILEIRPSSDVEKTLAIGYYLERVMGVSSFNINDLSRYFQLAKEPTPQNINDKVNMNIRKGHMTEAKEKKDSKKAWMVTSSGEQFLDNGFKDRE